MFLKFAKNKSASEPRAFKGSEKLIINPILGKGGAGKTTLTMRLARYLAEKGHKVLIVDMDMENTSSTYMYATLHNQNREKNAEWLNNLWLVPSSPLTGVPNTFYTAQLVSGDENSLWWNEAILYALRNSIDIILYDLPGAGSTTNPFFKFVLSQSDNIFQVIPTTSPEEIIASKMLFSKLRALGFGDKLHIVLNKVAILHKDIAEVQNTIRETGSISVTKEKIRASAKTNERRALQFVVDEWERELKRIYGKAESNRRLFIVPTGDSLINIHRPLSKELTAALADLSETALSSTNSKKIYYTLPKLIEEQPTSFTHRLKVGAILSLPFFILSLSQPIVINKPSSEIISSTIETTSNVRDVILFLYRNDNYTKKFISAEPFTYRVKSGDTFEKIAEWAFQRYTSYLNLDGHIFEKRAYYRFLRRINKGVGDWLRPGQLVNIAPPKEGLTRSTTYYKNLFVLQLLDSMIDGGDIRLVSPFSEPRTYGGRPGGHPGIDIAKRKGAVVKALRGGKVIMKGFSPSYGYYIGILVETAEGKKIDFYAHVARRMLVRYGQYVSKGTPIAYLSDTGRARGPHVHFEVRIKVSRRGYIQVNPVNDLLSWVDALTKTYTDVAHIYFKEGEVPAERLKYISDPYVKEPSPDLKQYRRHNIRSYHKHRGRKRSLRRVKHKRKKRHHTPSKSKRRKYHHKKGRR